jgi:hypothetical protein
MTGATPAVTPAVSLDRQQCGALDHSPAVDARGRGFDDLLKSGLGIAHRESSRNRGEVIWILRRLPILGDLVDAVAGR